SNLELIGASKEMGTIIHFKPDPEIFSMTEFKFDTIQERLREAAFLFPDLKITLTDERTDTTEVYQYEDALVSFRSEEHTSELQSRFDLVCRLLLEKKNRTYYTTNI